MTGSDELGDDERDPVDITQMPSTRATCRHCRCAIEQVAPDDWAGYGADADQRYCFQAPSGEHDPVPDRVCGEMLYEGARAVAYCAEPWGTEHEHADGIDGVEHVTLSDDVTLRADVWVVAGEITQINVVPDSGPDFR